MSFFNLKTLKRQDALTRQQSGFTLVEMAVVLVIIGVILGAVMVGRNVLENADSIKFQQKFINQWQVAYNSYLQRTGVPVGDSLAAPSQGVGNLANAGTNVVCAPDPIGTPILTNLPAVAELTTLLTLMTDSGVTLTTGLGPRPDLFAYTPENRNPTAVRICFANVPSPVAAPNTPEIVGNVMVINNITRQMAEPLMASIKGNSAPAGGIIQVVGGTWPVAAAPFEAQDMLVNLYLRMDR